MPYLRQRDKSAARRRSESTPAGRAKKAARKLANAWAQKGRTCKWCLARDGDRPFEDGNECTKCARQRVRRSCERCGGPSYVRGLTKGCVRAYELPFGVPCSTS